MIRTIDPSPLRLPPPAELMRRCRGAAILDAILEPDWQFRYFSFAPRWGEDGELMGSMRDGEGEHWHYILAPTPDRAFLKA